MTTVVLILTTVPSGALGQTIATALVDERLAACVNILPEMTSVYRWQGAVRCDAERQLVIKTTDDKISAIESRLAALHTYDLPELLVLPIGRGSSRYLEWVCGEVT